MSKSMSKGRKVDKADTVEACPYCSNPELFAQVLATPAENRIEGAPVRRNGPQWRYMKVLTPNLEWHQEPPSKEITEKRGDYFLITIPDSELVDRFAGFTILLLGKQVSGPTYALTSTSPGPFFAGGMLNAQTHWQHFLFFAFRMIHKDSRIAVDVHLWPGHERIATLRNIPNDGMLPKELNIVNEALKNLRTETRGGGPKIEEVELIEAIQRLGEKATQRAVAKALKVSPRALRDFQSKRGETWEHIKKRSLETELI